ncbi:hypothetical protein [Blastopirellula retiformator]|uniref:Uncharacterized protein n=1 Tax=Blastopirellula retiformator TaxID=2527970 RepID=A0A5C5UVR0_9BACT|nr:hypothetical protein [Blastopirellula retiformator]TWT29627.1 hypothetical protein Enr8_48150 [Blastopirellula retiformator]
MKRSLLFSERVLIQTLLAKQDPLDDLFVVEEYIPWPQDGGKRQFNSDFALNFTTPLPRMGNRTVKAKSIHYRCIGSELFLVTEPSGRPVRLELLNGPAVPKKLFAEAISLIEETISSNLIQGWQGEIKSAPFLRIFDFEDSVLFLVSSIIDVKRFAGHSSVSFESESCRLQANVDAKEGCSVEGIVYR